ncbi:MFS-type transporter involved in bile tolerance, Atg22 family [Halobacillus dabanensis]|uniref:MFS-type transporter involved in bile tolerance, Atg22 family n=1 Tax=Halobacillus dabanensis TaxID=240302 RepID=A0A1I3Q6M3_HALDA|nr:MFS transporter [Halobacillus dabanensis]SFJ29528.1 MFS-type transporter involved in bile tolerance, Atg22 family [Halobacillus dabanensis]
MDLKKVFYSWRNPLLLLFGIGLSNIGDWIYLIAFNLIVLDMTGSPLAVAALYILKPLAALFTNFWSGTIIDRLNLRNLMVGLDIFRSALIFILPSLPSVWLIYPVVFLINMGSAVFEPASMTYITKLIPSEKRKRFNSFRSLIDSGGFLIGPAIAGWLFILGTPYMAIYVNALTFLGSGLITLLLPPLEDSILKQKNLPEISLRLLKKDWNVVRLFTRNSPYVMVVYFLFSLMMVMAAALDSLEAAFSKEVLQLSDTEYGFLVSIAGGGIAVGAVVNTVLAKKMTTSLLIGLGSLSVSVGYIVYAFSTSFDVAALGFIVLSFSLAFANTGFHTFYQENIPVNVMGRVGSIYGLIEAFFIILATISIGLTAQSLSIKSAVMVGSFLMLLVTGALCFTSFYFERKSEEQVYDTETSKVYGK